MNRIQQVEAIETPTLTADGELLARFLKRRDDDAFAELLTRHGAMVFGVCLRGLGRTQDAEDAFQAVFLALAQQAEQLVDRPSVGPWLYTVARRVSGKALRSRRRRRWVFWGSTPEPATKPTAEATVDLDAALATLSEPERSAVILCHLEGLSRAEAAKALGCPEGTLSARLSRALEKLRRKLGKPPLAMLAAASLVMLPETLPASTVGLVHHLRDGTLDDGVSPRTLDLFREALPMRWLNRVGPLLSSLIAAGLILVGDSFGWQMINAQQPKGDPSGQAGGDAAPKGDPFDRGGGGAVPGLGDAGGQVPLAGGRGEKSTKSPNGAGTSRNGAALGMMGQMPVVTLADAVRMFNEYAKKKSIGKTQPPLTEEEVIAAIRGQGQGQGPQTVFDEHRKLFQEIAANRSITAPWGLNSTERLRFNNFDFDVWRIELTISTGPNESSTLRIRDQWIRSRPAGVTEGNSVEKKELPPSVIVHLKYTPARRMAEMLKAAEVTKSKGVSFSIVSSPTNSIIIHAPVEKHQVIEKAIQAFDELNNQK